jgi:serine/threonine protein kinase
MCGTPEYMAPEVLNSQPYGLSVGTTTHTPLKRSLLVFFSLLLRCMDQDEERHNVAMAQW